MTDAPQIHVVAAVITDAAGRYLLVRKRGTTVFMQPGGKIEAGESLRDALVRELNEELGLEIDPQQLIAMGRFDAQAANEAGHRVIADVFRVPGTPGETARVDQEIEEMRWYDPSEPRGRDIAPLTVMLLGPSA